MKVVTIAGARPNFVKVAPLLRAMREHRDMRPVLVHTGQHYDAALSDQFFKDLDIPPPDINLDVGSGSHATQTADVMRRLEPVFLEVQPDLALVVGDVNSTLAAAVTASKLGIRVAHVEAGLRSFDRTMPEEINRVVTDAVSDLHFVSEESGCENLLREGIAPAAIHFVGNVMIDALEASRQKWQSSVILRSLGIPPDQPYAVLTLHRPSNVDDPGRLQHLLDALREVAWHLPIVFPVHPRVRPRLPRNGCVVSLGSDAGGGLPRTGITCIPPLGYLDFVALMSRARLVLTDSGGIQEETTILGVPCLTLRDSTERPVTVTHGTNRVIGANPARVPYEVFWTLDHPVAPLGPPPLWDGRAAQRIVDVLQHDAAPSTRVSDRPLPAVEEASDVRAYTRRTR